VWDVLRSGGASLVIEVLGGGGGGGAYECLRRFGRFHSL